MNNEYLNYAATERQKECVEAVIEHDTYTQAANALGINVRTLERTVQRVKQQAARKGFAPEHDMTRPAPDGFTVKGTSTLYDAEGNVSNQWVKTQQSHEQQKQLMEEAIKAMAEEIPREGPVTKPARKNKDLLNTYIISDLHIGQLSWPEETQDAWDTNTAEETLVRWFQQAIESSPDAHTGLFIQLGDLLDFDSMEPVTPTSGNIMDVDSRYPHLVRVAIRAMRRIVRMLLEKHEHVHIMACDANHDPTAGIWLREWMAALYENEPRITVDTSPESYNAFEFGKVGVYAHHGHKRKPHNVTDVIVSRFREIYGRTKYTYVHMGHLHHKEKESSVAVVEQHQTLAAPSDYAARGGYLAGRSAQAITYHREYGEVGRVRITPEML